MPAKRLFLIDAYSFLFRAFYAGPRLATSKGLPTNAIYVFIRMVDKVIKEHRPDYLALVFDYPAPTFRHERYKDYKAHRDRMPDELSVQIPYIFKLAEAYNLPRLELPGAEADDLIGTVAKRAEAEGFDVTIITADKDIWQILSDKVHILDTTKDEIFGPEKVRERFKVSPAQIPDIKGLAGDSSDNIPGVPGIGEKTASDLISEFGSVENLLENLDRVKGDKKRESIRENAEIARLSKELATIRVDLPVTLDFEGLKLREPDRERLKGILEDLEFATLRKEVSAEAQRPAVYEGLKIISTRSELKKDISAAQDQALLTIFPLLTGDEPMRHDLIGLGLSAGAGKGYYLPWLDGIEGARDALKGLMEEGDIIKYSNDIKALVVILSRLGMELKGRAIDASIAAYLLEPGRDSYSLENLAFKYLDYRTIFSQKGIKRESKEGLSLFKERPAEVACEAADVTLRLAKTLLPDLKREGLERLFYEVEMPLAHVLADMERTGVKLDPSVLNRMSKDLERELRELTREIYAEAGEEFNINSPIQLREILFNKLKLTPVTKTKTGYSTEAGVLEKLALEHPLPALILKYREREKLKNTYVDALPGLINRETGRIHSCFSQTVTATGRLSSKNPNLQNIPVRTELGKRIREAFVAEAGYLILSADYSQIELRILAHLSEDPKLVEAFKKGEDVHVRTATEIFGVPEKDVTPQMRDLAKTVNFGIIYGISPFRLYKDLGIEMKKGKEYIDRYFKTYTGVARFRDRLLQEAREKGFVTTLLGRRRRIPDINDRNANIRERAEREAINTPIQGTAADMIKVAMVNIWKRLKGKRSRMILSVHDELIFETFKGEMEEVKAIAKECMETSLPLKVSVKVKFASGENWGETY